jgi:hypothetical protein
MVSAPAAFLRHLAALPGWQGPGGRRSYSWVDQRLRAGQFGHPDGTPVRPLRTPGGYRRFTLAIRRMRTLIGGSILPETRPDARQGRNYKRRSMTSQIDCKLKPNSRASGCLPVFGYPPYCLR